MSDSVLPTAGSSAPARWGVLGRVLSGEGGCRGSHHSAWSVPQPAVRVLPTFLTCGLYLTCAFEIPLSGFFWLFIYNWV